MDAFSVSGGLDLAADNIRLETQQVVATALAQRMISQPQAEVVLAQAANYERRGGAPVGVLDLMLSLNLITAVQAATLKKLHESAAPPQTFSIGKYLLTNRLGAGAMGTVYLAVDQMLQRKVALKVLSPQLAALPEFVARFKREARTTAQLSHRNIVHVHEVDEIDGYLFYVMEYLEGQGLDDLVKKRGRLPPEEAIAYVIQAARGLEAAHRAKIIHRDVKPANLFLTSDGTIKLVDLGLSKDTSNDAKASDQSMAGMAIGTPHYIAPEQARGVVGIDGRADIYGLGCTLYTLLTGGTPYTGPNPLAIMNKQINEPPPDPRTVVPSLPAAYAALIELMMAKNPNDRYQNSSELIADLERVQAGKAPMGASADVAADSGGDIPALRRRPVTGKRGSSGPVTSVGRPRQGSSLALDLSRGGESSGLRRASAVVARRVTAQYDRIGTRAAPSVDGEPWWRRYAWYLGVGGGVLVVIVVIALVAAFSGGKPVHSSASDATADGSGPGRQVGAVAPPSKTPQHAPPVQTPPPKTPTHDPGEPLSPYEEYRLHHPAGSASTPAGSPATSPAPSPSPGDGATPSPEARVFGDKPRSYEPPPKGFRPLIFFDGQSVEVKDLGAWYRVDPRVEGNLHFLRYSGHGVAGLQDLQWPYFQWTQDRGFTGRLLVRVWMRRSADVKLPVKFNFYDKDTGRILSLDLNAGTTAPGDWGMMTGLVTKDCPNTNQFELRSGYPGTQGETLDIGWMEIDQAVNGGESDAPATHDSPTAPDRSTAPADSAGPDRSATTDANLPTPDTHTPSASALVHLDGRLMAENGAVWRRMAPQREGKTAFVRWVFAGHVIGPGEIESPLLQMSNGFSWHAPQTLLVHLRIRGIGVPRFNLGVKLFYVNPNGTSLESGAKLQFTTDEWGDWVDRTVAIEVVGDGTFKELELRPFDTDVKAGSIDIDWLEITSKGG
ncbi:MAG: protein kinase domain-containing protein [Planctomycetota bacterium]